LEIECGNLDLTSDPMKKKILLLLPLVLIIMASLSVSAHEILLKNGDRLSGIVISRDRDSVVLETQYAGRIRIAMEYIESIDLERPLTNVSAAGERTEASDPKPKEPEKLADTSANKPAPPKNNTETKPAAPPAVKAPARLFGGSRYFGLIDDWEGNANVGFSYTSGNSRTSTMATGIRASKAGAKDKLTVYLRSLWNSNRRATQQTTQNAVWGGFRYDRDFNERLFSFASWDFERDRPKRLNFRSVIGGGLGHHTIKNDRTELDVLFGLAWNRAWQVGENTDTPEALAAGVFKHKFNDRLKVQKTFTVYQDMTHISKYRFIFDASLSADITKRIGWFITVGDRFNNRPIGLSEKNDFLLTTGIKWNFGKRK
jgi:putative salt-induced outer membrane protein YdiY